MPVVIDGLSPGALAATVAECERLQPLIVACPPCKGTGERVDNIIGPLGEVRVCTACGGTGKAR